MEGGLNTLYQTLVNAAEICYQKGVRHVVLSPGSRSAPIALAFLRHPNIESLTIVDERSAAFKALGVSQGTQRPVALICTSGTAALNFGPAIAEAFWQGVPLIAFTADRPYHWIGQGANQAIYQNGIFGDNIKSTFSLPQVVSEIEKKTMGRYINEALNTATRAMPGPVQINAPFEEPFYPDGPMPEPEPDLQVIDHLKVHPQINEVDHSKIARKLKNHSKVLLIAGLHPGQNGLTDLISDFITRAQAVFITDPLSNCQEVNDAVHHADLIFNKALEEGNADLAPDLLITLGGPILSKSLKQYFQAYKPSEHWHIATNNYPPDPFGALSRVINSKPSAFLKDVGSRYWPNTQNDYKDYWVALNQSVEKTLKGKLNEQATFSESRVMKSCLQSVSSETILHLGNSLPVRHAQFVGLSSEFLANNVVVRANRGTSGIDGCLSTAVGNALVTEKPVNIILGDLAFMYDRNALWQSQLPSNLAIIIFNNNGGGIFRTLPGAKEQPELDSYFASTQTLTFQETAKQHNCGYHPAHDWESLQEGLNNLHVEKHYPFIVEVFFENGEENFADQEALKKAVQSSITWD